MNHKVLKVSVLATLGMLISTPVFAAKYIVSFKDKAAFGQAHAQYIMSNQLNLSQVTISSGAGFDRRPLAVGQLKVEESLRNLKSMIVDTNDEKAIQALVDSGAIDFVEPEIFHPAPQPMQNYRPWKPWDVSVAQPVSEDVFAQKVGLGPKTPWGIKAVKAPQAWDSAKLGQGARVLVLDTGLDKNHPAFKGSLEAGRDFTSEAASDDITDTVGHGTHVAGTILGVQMSDGFTGVAPHAKLLMGRVCLADGCSNIAVSRGIEWGIEQKVDVISMSLGGPLGSVAERKATEVANAAGVVIVAATGNDGSNKVSFPAGFPTVVAVGAIGQDNKRAQFSQYGPELDVMAPGVGVTSSVPMGSGRESSVQVRIGSAENHQVNSSTFVGTIEVKEPMTQELVHANLGNVVDFEGLDLKGKFALIQRGEISFGDKAKNAIAAGAAGVVVYNNTSGLLQGAVTTDGSVLPIPVMMVEQTVGEEMTKALKAGQVVSATVQTKSTDYSAFDGTSMATPHVSGVVALIKAANKRLTPAEVRQILAETSTNIGATAEYGAGLVNAEAAVQKALLK